MSKKNANRQRQPQRAVDSQQPVTPSTGAGEKSVLDRVQKLLTSTATLGGIAISLAGSFQILKGGASFWFVAGLVVAWLSSLYVFWRLYLRQALSRDAGTRRRLSQWGARISLALLFIIPVGGVLAYLYLNHVPAPEPGKRRFVIADFEKLGKEEHPVTETLLQELRSTTSRFNDNIEIMSLGEVVSVRDGDKRARERGKDLGADFVIWGSYVDNRVSTNFEPINDRTYLQMLRNSERRSMNPSEQAAPGVETRWTDGTSFQVLLALGLERMSSGGYDRAVECFDDATQLASVPEKMRAPAFYWRAIAYAMQENTQQAEADYSEGLRLLGNDGSASSKQYSALTHLGLGVLRANANRYEDALKEYDAALLLAPNMPEAYLNRGFAYAGLAETEYDSVRKKDLYGKAGEQFRQAAQQVEKAPRDEESKTAFKALSLSSRGSVLSMIGSFDEAEADLQESLRLAPDMPDVHFHRGNILHNQKNYTQALESYSRALELDSQSYFVYMNRAWVHLLLGDGSAADADAERYIKLRQWADKYSLYMAIVSYVGQRQSGKPKEEARRNLFESVAQSKLSEWPNPIVHYLCGEVKEEELLRQAHDAGQMTEARGILSADLLLSGLKQEAQPHLEWLKNNGVTSFNEYKLAMAEETRATASGR